MVDALDFQEIERLPDIIGRPLLAGMRYGMQAKAAGAGEHALELRRRMALLRRVETDADDAIAPRQRLVERALGTCLVEMAQERQDQRRGDAELALAVQKRTPQAVNHRLEGDAALGMALRIEEYLGVAYVLGGGAAQIGHREVVKVLLVPQHAHAAIIEVEEVLQIAE